MKINELYLIKINDVFVATKSFAKAIKLGAYEVNGQKRLNLYNISALSKSFDSNIDCYYARYSVMCDNTSIYNTKSID